jgi:hypothetical protein
MDPFWGGYWLLRTVERGQLRSVGGDEHGEKARRLDLSVSVGTVRARGRPGHEGGPEQQGSGQALDPRH